MTARNAAALLAALMLAAACAARAHPPPRVDGTPLVPRAVKLRA